RSRAACRRHRARKPLSGLRPRLLLALHQRPVEHRRVRPAAACRPRRPLDDGAAARARRRLPGCLARGRREPRGLPRLGPQGRGVEARGVPLPAGTAGALLPARGRINPAWGFVGPALLAIGAFFFVPVAASLLLSFTDFDVYAVARPDRLRFVALGNYARLLGEPRFWTALGNTAYFVVVGGPLSV